MPSIARKIAWPIVGIGVCLLGVVFGPLKPYIIPPIKKFLYVHLWILADMLFYIFIACCLVLGFLLFLLERDRRKLDYSLPEYKSEFVATDYYKGVKKIDYYRAIKNYLSKYRVRFEEDEAPRQSGEVKKRMIFRKRYTKGSENAEIDREKRREEAYRDYNLDSQLASPENVQDGVVRTHFPNGQVEQEAHFKGGRLHGTYRKYYPDGQLNQEKNYKEGKLDGKFIAFDEYGIPYFEMFFREGVKEGIETTFYKNGVIQYKDYYLNGQKISRKTFSETGELKFDHTYVDEDDLSKIKNLKEEGKTR